MRSHCIALGSWCTAMALALPLHAADKSSLPDEITAIGGQGAGQAGAGAALISDQGAIHINPAMLYRHKNYDLNGTYVWPVNGRPFYRAAAIDGVTSKWTAAFEYTGFSDALDKRETRTEIDSPVRRRGSLAFAIPSDFLSIGFAGHYVEAEDPTVLDEAKTIKGFTLGTGLAAQLSSGISVGASVENLNNEKLKNVSPRTIRAGVAWQDKTGSLAFHADYRDRQRSAYLEDLPLTSEGMLLALDPAVEPATLKNEKMAIIGGQFQTFDVLRVFFAAGRNVSGDKSEVTSGGLGIFQKNFSLAYMVSRIYPDAKDLQNSLHLSITMKM
ncbi:MAG: hypothetical protein EOP07_15620 [Proteobacteria bacterium]|nr:MAG: hypothetical protein EOP07_15620 [Pseudomonadota bacterium]